MNEVSVNEHYRLEQNDFFIRKTLGREQLDGYRRIFSLSTALMALASVVMLACGYAFVRPIMKLLCGNAQGISVEMAETYYRFYVPGGAMTMMAYIPLYFLRVEGKPKDSSRLFTMSAVVNILLSWLLISPVCNMGIAGVSLATSVSMGCVAVLGFIRLFSGRTELRFVKGGLEKAQIKEIIIAGLPNGISNLLESARILLVNMLLIYSGSALMLTCYTVIRNINEILCTRSMTPAEIADKYEKNTGVVIVETFKDLSPEDIPDVVVYSHGPFAWGMDPFNAVHNAVVMEEVAFMDYHALMLNPEHRDIQSELMDRHYLRKHGANAYYGQR